ncbi:DUF2237 domain-containing protein [Corallincola platygyrae]|uniref:DUF2237 domain-containing protein n=1 Tax=Corallincola platygyrae TaxID=1193278 RepID=A0ABW4XQ68_9GAMM
MEQNEKSLLGKPLIPCSTAPMTGFFRDGCCRHSDHDPGSHTVCAMVTEEFLAFSAERGNDLSTPRPEFDFPGLKPGDRWCLCAPRWLKAHKAGVAPPVILAATSEAALEIIDRELLMAFGIN